MAIRLFLTCWLIYTLHFATNTVREIYPALSLGDHLSFDVSEYLGFHPDIFEIKGRGAYINNNPGASILGAIPYTIARPIIDKVVSSINTARTADNIPAPDYNSIYPMARDFYLQAFEKGLDVKFGLAAGVMQAFLMAPISALSVVVMFFILENLIQSPRKAVFLALLYGFATPIFYRTAQLNHNLLQTHFAFFAFVLIWRPWDKDKNQGRPRYLLSGLLVGWTLVLDYSGIIIILIVGAYALLKWLKHSKEDRKYLDIIKFGIGISVSASILFAYQWLAFGTPIYPAQHYMPQTTYSVLGYQGMDWPHLDLIWLLTFGRQYGLFISAPLLLLIFYIPGWLKEQIRIIERFEIWFIFIFSMTFLLFSAANQFSRMQFNSGIRHLLPIVPFLFLIVAGVLLNMPTWLAWVVGIATTYWSWTLAMYRDVEQGLGIYESLLHITKEGPRLPWLTTMKNIGLTPEWLSAWLLFLLAGLVILIFWAVPPMPNRIRRRRNFNPDWWKNNDQEKIDFQTHAEMLDDLD